MVFLSMRRRSLLVFLAVLGLTFAFDQGSKAWARTLPVSPQGCEQPAELLAHRCGGVPQPITDGSLGQVWSWELAYNPGAAFSSLAGGAGSVILLSVLAMLALAGIGVVAARTREDERWKRFALALIAGGALGNLVDRLRDGAVTDFIRWSWHDHVWPIFNVADAALLVGVVLLAASGLRKARVPGARGAHAAA